MNYTLHFLISALFIGQIFASHKKDNSPRKNQCAYIIARAEKNLFDPKTQYISYKMPTINATTKEKELLQACLNSNAQSLKAIAQELSFTPENNNIMNRIHCKIIHYTAHPNSINNDNRNCELTASEQETNEIPCFTTPLDMFRFGADNRLLFVVLRAAKYFFDQETIQMLTFKEHLDTNINTLITEYFPDVSSIELDPFEHQALEVLQNLSSSPLPSVDQQERLKNIQDNFRKFAKTPTANRFKKVQNRLY